MTLPTPNSNIPSKIDRYEIIEELGRGGHAIVYRAFDPRTRRKVAVKVLKRTFWEEKEYRARFRREVQTVAALEYTAIVPVYDFGEENGQPYIVMSLMPGGSLNDKLLQGQIPLEEAIQIITRLAQSLEVAHSKGIVHRDIKPDNILFDQYNQAYIADFGIAHIVEATTKITMDGATIGTPAYMSPEQVQDGRNIDGRSDIYALGVIFYQMLMGEPPYQSDTPARVLMMHILEPVPSLLDSLPELPPAIESWLQTTMAKEPDDRFATAAEMSDALQRAYEANEVVVPPPTAPPPREIPVPKPRRRFPLALILIFVTVLAFGVGYLVFNYLLFPDGTRTPATQPNATPHTAQAETAATTPSHTPTAIPPTETARPPATSTPTTFEENSTATPAQELAETATPALPATPAIIVGGADKLAFVGGNEIWIANPDGSEAKQLTSAGGGSKTGLQWTPDGQSITYITNKCVLAVDIESEQVSIIFCASWAEYIGAFQFSPDGTQVALSLSDGLFVLPYNLGMISSIRTKQQLEDAEICTRYTDADTKAVRWSRDGQQIAVVTVVTDLGRAVDRIKVLRIDQCGRSPIPIDEFPRSNDVMVEYDQDPIIADFDWNGEALFALTVEKMRGFGEIYIYNMNSKKTETIQPLERWCCYLGFRWNPDGDYFLFAFQDIQYNNPPSFYNPIYGTIGSGIHPDPLPLPEHALTGENPHPAFRTAP